MSKVDFKNQRMATNDNLIKTTHKKEDEKEVFLTNQSVIRNTKRMANEVTVSKVQTKSTRYTDIRS